MTEIFFNEKEHAYFLTDGRELISATTLIERYEQGFDKFGMAKACAAIGQNPTHPKYPKYANKTVDQILKEWDKTSKKATDKGTKKHDWLERNIKESTGIRHIPRSASSGNSVKLATVESMIDNPNLGVLKIDELERRIGKRFPDIFRFMRNLYDQGYRFFPELCVFNLDHMISGLVDLLVVKEKEFLILDWKTNKSEIRYESGYFKKDSDGNVTDEFVFQNDMMKVPLDGLDDSVGNHYALQISLYTWMLQEMGYTNSDPNFIFQIRDVGNKEIVNKYLLPDYTRYVKWMVEDYSKKES